MGIWEARSVGYYKYKKGGGRGPRQSDKIVGLVPPGPSDGCEGTGAGVNVCGIRERPGFIIGPFFGGLQTLGSKGVW